MDKIAHLVSFPWRKFNANDNCRLNTPWTYFLSRDKLNSQSVRSGKSIGSYQSTKNLTTVIPALDLLSRYNIHKVKTVGIGNFVMKIVSSCINLKTS